MTAYWVARVKINDPVEYKKYTDLVPDILKKFEGRVLARGGRFQILEGPDTFERNIVVEFPSLEQAVACHASPEYQEARKYRLGGVGQNELVIVEAGDPTKEGAPLFFHREADDSAPFALRTVVNLGVVKARMCVIATQVNVMRRLNRQ